MNPRRWILAAGAGAGLLYILSYYVAISARHTVELFPWRPLGEWRIGSPVGLASFYALLLAGLFLLYLLAFIKIRRSPAAGRNLRGAVYAGAILAILVLLFVPSFLSKDLFDYMVHGRILTLHRANPFEVPASAFPPDEFLRAMGWPQYTTMYGPGWVSACALLSWIFPGSLAGSVLAYKTLFAAAHLGNGLMIGSLLRSWGRPSLEGELLYLWNPLLILQVAGQGHNDVFLMTCVLLGLHFAQRHAAAREVLDEALAVICLTLSILVKYVTAPLLALYLAVRWRETGGIAGLGRAALLAILAAAVLLVGYMPYMAGMDLLHFLRPYEHAAYQGGALMLLDQFVKWQIGADPRGIYPESVADIMLVASTMLAAVLAAFGVILLLRVRELPRVPQYGLYVLLFYLLAAAALLRVSYGVWIVALAALVPPGLVRRVAFLTSATLLSLEVFWVYAIRMAPTGISLHREQAFATLVAVGVPIAYLLAGSVRARAGR